MPALSRSVVERIAISWASAKDEADRWGKRATEQNEKLKGLMPSYGVRDPNDGHYYMDVTLPDGTGMVVQMQMRQTIIMDPDLAAQLLTEHDKLMQYSAFEVRVLDNDKAAEFLSRLKYADKSDVTGLEVNLVPTEESVRQAYFDKVLNDAEYREIFTTTETPALYRQKGRR